MNAGQQFSSNGSLLNAGISVSNSYLNAKAGVVFGETRYEDGKLLAMASKNMLDVISKTILKTKLKRKLKMGIHLEKFPQVFKTLFPLV